MTRLPRPRRPDRLIPPLLLVGAALAAGALTPTEWAHRQEMAVPAPGLVRVALPDATLDAATADLRDLRVVDPGSRELSLLLDRPMAAADRQAAPAGFEVQLQDSATVLTLATGSLDPLTAVALETPHPFFLIAAKVEISPDGTSWTVQREGAPLFRQFGAEQLEFPLPAVSVSRVRVTLTAPRGTVPPFTGARLHFAAGPVPAPVTTGLRIAQREEFAGETVLTLALEGRHGALSALTFNATDAAFLRRVSVGVREVRDGQPAEKIVGRGCLYRLALDGASAQSRLDLPLDYIPTTRELLVHIHNGDSPPLALASVQALRRPANLYFVANVAGPHALLTGNPQASVPRYDLAALGTNLVAAAASVVTPGPLQAQTGYRPRENLADSTWPELPLAGAALDPKPWTHRKPVHLAEPGVQELELDLETLAHSRLDGSDLRLLADDRQLPYVRERTTLSRALALTPTPQAEPKRPNVSRWRLHLPQSRLPVGHLILTSPTPLFQRRIRVYENATDSYGAPRQNTLASAEWSRTPEPGSVASLDLALAGPPAGDTLWIETDNGDNPPLDLNPVQATTPVVRLLFLSPVRSDLTLAYGNPQAEAPHYDLSLVATRLLTAHRHVARLGSAEGPMPSSAPEGGSSANRLIFWGALAAVVVVLLAVVARFLPKPPA